MTGYGFTYDNPDAASIQQAFSLAETWSNQGLIAEGRRVLGPVGDVRPLDSG